MGHSYSFLDVQASIYGPGGNVSLAGDEADAVPLRARVEQVDRPGRVLGSDLDARHLVAQLERQLERGGGGAVAGLEREAGLAEPLPPGREGMHDALARRPTAAQHGRLELAVTANGAEKPQRLAALLLVPLPRRSV